MAKQIRLGSVLDWLDGVVGVVMFSIAALFLLPVTAFAAVQQARQGVWWSSVAAGIALAVGVRLLRWRQSATRRWAARRA